MYLFAVHEMNKDQTCGQLIYQCPLDSAAEITTLKEQLLAGDKKIERQPFYFPHLQQAMKAETVFLRAIALVQGFFLDLVTFPYRTYTYGEYKNQLKQNLPIYQYLQSHKAPQRYLDQDRFIIIFYSEEEPAAPWFHKDGLFRMILGDNYNPVVVQNRNFQKYQTYGSDVYDGITPYYGAGMALLTDEVIQKMRQTFVAS
jgi:hypothetical protein